MRRKANFYNKRKSYTHIYTTHTDTYNYKSPVIFHSEKQEVCDISHPIPQ